LREGALENCDFTKKTQLQAGQANSLRKRKLGGEYNNKARR